MDRSYESDRRSIAVIEKYSTISSARLNLKSSKEKSRFRESMASARHEEVLNSTFKLRSQRSKRTEDVGGTFKFQLNLP